MIELMALAQQCAPNVAPATVVAVARVESSFNPYAIGVVGGALKRQPTSLAEALTTVRELERQGRNFSLGIVQVNRHNLPKYGLTYEQAFDACHNLRIGGKILQECYARALPSHRNEQLALRAAFSCYYSGNFIRGFRPDRAGMPSYVQKVVAAASNRAPVTLQVPAVQQAGDMTKLIAARPFGHRHAEGSVLVGAASAESTQAATPALQDPSTSPAAVQPFVVQADAHKRAPGSTGVPATRGMPNVPNSPHEKADNKVVF